MFVKENPDRKKNVLEDFGLTLTKGLDFAEEQGIHHIYVAAIDLLKVRK